MVPPSETSQTMGFVKKPSRTRASSSPPRQPSKVLRPRRSSDRGGPCRTQVAAPVDIAEARLKHRIAVIVQSAWIDAAEHRNLILPEF
jgi:hypothetical protein